MAILPTQCPSCQASLTVTRLACPGCSTQLEGEFAVPALLQLPPADLAFVLRFVLESGSLKAMARQEGQSYPTIRNRLNEIIAQLAAATAATHGDDPHAILDAVAQGNLSVAEATARLKGAAK